MATRSMDSQKVREMADQLEQVSNMLKQVDSRLDNNMMRLETTAFIGLVGGTMAKNYLGFIQPFMDQMVKKYMEMANDARAAADAWDQANRTG